MAEQHPTKESDLDKARLIVGRYGSFLALAGEASEHIARAVAEGIALGRHEGLTMAAEAVAKLKADND
jgi:hypothetical protein